MPSRMPALPQSSPLTCVISAIETPTPMHRHDRGNLEVVVVDGVAAEPQNRGVDDREDDQEQGDGGARERLEVGLDDERRRRRAT